VTTNATRVANTQGGAQSRRVTVRLYPSVAVRVGKNALNEREMMMEVILHGVDKSDALLEYGRNVLQCHIYNLPIHQGIEKSLSLALGFGLALVTNTSVLFHSLLSQPCLNRG